MRDFLEQKGGSLYFMLCMIVFLFVVYSGNEGNHYIDIPHIEIPILPLYIVISLTFVFVALLCTLRSAKIDLIGMLLIAPLIVHLINSLYVGVTSEFYVHYTTSILSLCVYLITINMNGSPRFIEKMFFLFFVILSIQIVSEYVLSGSVESHYAFKHDMRIPIGESNALTTKLLPFFAILFSIENNKTKKIVMAVFTFFVVAITRSRGGIIDFICVLSILLLWRGKINVIIVLKSMVLFAFLGMAFFFFFDSEFGQTVFLKNDHSIVERFVRWDKCIDLFWNHPILGNGFYYNVLADNPHNVVIDLIMRSGLVGFFVALVISINLLSHVRKNIANKYIRGAFVGLVALFIQGCVEIVFFSYVHEIIIWTIAGYLVKKSECLQNEKIGFSGQVKIGSIIR